jgi:hypothetical protein
MHGVKSQHALGTKGVLAFEYEIWPCVMQGHEDWMVCYLSGSGRTEAA